MQTFEIEIDGIRTEIGVAQFFDKTASGELDAEERVWLDGVQGRARDVDERLVNKELIFYLKNTVQEIEIERIFSSETSNFLEDVYKRQPFSTPSKVKSPFSSPITA